MGKSDKCNTRTGFPFGQSASQPVNSSLAIRLTAFHHHFAMLKLFATAALALCLIDALGVTLIIALVLAHFYYYGPHRK